MKINYSTDTNDVILHEIKKALETIQWGSLEIFIQDSKVVQITERNIKKMRQEALDKKDNSKKVVR